MIRQHSELFDLTPVVCDPDGQDLPLQLDSIREEVSGSIRQVYVVAAHIQSLPFITLQLRLTHWASAGLLQVEIRIRNTRRAEHAGGLWDLGDAGSFRFAAWKLSSPVTKFQPARRHTGKWSEFIPSVQRRPKSLCDNSAAAVQTGTAQITSQRRDRSNVQARGYEVTADSQTTGGIRAEPTLLVEGDSSFLAVAVPEFWQQFPGSVASAMGTLGVGFVSGVAVSHIRTSGW